MTSYTEEALLFECGEERLTGILHLPQSVQKTGVVIVVGGPQYRVGSHRQFVLLARYLADHGVPVFRFDVRGMGDSDGDIRSFEQINADIKAAIDTFFSHVPEVENVLLWGLCDAASAILFYAQQDERVDRMLLLNPWVRTESGQARAYLRHYYKGRLFTSDFWKKLFAGEFSFFDSLKTFFNILNQSRGSGSSVVSSGRLLGHSELLLPDRMREGLAAFNGKVQIVLSGQDLTASEFKDLIEASQPWQRLLASKQVLFHYLDESNHTFSKQEWRDRVAVWTLECAKA